jgi:hypothetical protein
MLVENIDYIRATLPNVGGITEMMVGRVMRNALESCPILLADFDRCAGGVPPRSPVPDHGALWRPVDSLFAECLDFKAGKQQTTGPAWV